MAKQYAFWQKENGTPDRKNGTRHAPVELLAKIGKSTSINNKGNLNWTLFDSPHFKSGIMAMLLILDPSKKQLNYEDSWKITRSSIIAIVKEQGNNLPISAEKFIDTVNTKSSKHFRKKNYNYVLVTSLSIKTFPATRLRVRQCNIAPLKTRGGRYPHPKVILHKSSTMWIRKHLESTQYKPIRVKTNGRTEHEAAENALNALNLLRGIWSLLSTYGSWSVSLTTRRSTPIGVIHIGPLHTLHSSGRKDALDLYWYEPSYIEDYKLYDPSKGWKHLEKNRRLAMRKISNTKYQAELETVIIRYAIALDQPNPDLSFLQMWSILETITDTVGSSYDETIRRTVWIFKDNKLPKELMAALRLRRNQLVHASKSGYKPRQTVYLIKTFIDEHLLYLIHNDFNVSSFKEYGGHLALTRDIDALKCKQERLEVAIRFLDQANDSQ